jgi:hypothetical protein
MKNNVGCRLRLSIIILNCLLCPALSFTQDDDWDFDEKTSSSSLGPAFNDTRVVNGHSVEVLENKTFDLRISHRFGDIAVPASGRTLFGLDNSTDIRIGFEYGITEKLMLGAGRSKGFPTSEYWDGLIKYQLLKQSEKQPLSITLANSAFITSRIASSDTTSIWSFNYNTANNFQSFANRISYFTQLILAHNLKDKLSVQLSAGVLHRNFVTYADQNTNLVIGAMSKINVYKKISLVGEYYYVLRKNNIGYVNPLAVSVEIKTFAHVFQLNFMNSRGIGEGQFIPYTSSKWLDGEFRFGFTISRHF